MPRVSHIRTKFHDLIIDLETGEYTTSRVKLPRHNRVEWDESIEPIRFESVLHEAFRLYGEPSETIDFIYEIAGNQLIGYTNIDTALYGDPKTSKTIWDEFDAVCGSSPFSTITKSIFTPKQIRTESVDIAIPVDAVFIADLRQNFESEYPGILREVIKGARRLIKRKRFEIPKSCTDAFESMMRNTDPVGNFIRDKLTHIPGAMTRMSDIYEAFITYTGGDLHIGIYNLRDELKSAGMCTEYRKFEDFFYCFGVALKMP